MERDFLGMNGKDSGSLAREEARGSRQELVFGGGSAVQWPLVNRISALQQFMSYKAGQEERAKKLVFDQLAQSGCQPITTSDALETNYKASPVQAQQKCFSFDRQGAHPFSMHAYQSQSNNPPGVQMHHSNEAKPSPMVMHHSIPFATSGPFFKVHGSPNGPNLSAATLKQQPLGGGFASNGPVAGSFVGAFSPRNVSKPSPTAQMTIFYAGSVNVYDDVPLDKAQAIMFLASKGSNASSNALNPRPQTPAPSLAKLTAVDGLSMNQTQTQIQTQNQTLTPSHAASPHSGLSSPLSVTPHTVVQSGSDCSTTDDLVGAKTSGLSTTNNQNDPSKAAAAALGSAPPVSVMPRAIPQARKASLARFLEKRKERVTNAAPYVISNKLSENSVGIEGPPSKSSSNDIGVPKNHEELWKLGSQHKNCIDSGESLSTKLEM